MPSLLPPHDGRSLFPQMPGSSSLAGIFSASLAVAALLTMLSPCRSLATDYTYISGAAASWTTNGTWETSAGVSTGNPNGPGDNIVGNSGIGNLTVDTSREVNNFTISTVAGASTWTILATAARSLTIDGTLTMNGAGGAIFRNGGGNFSVTAGNVAVNSGQLTFGSANTQLNNLSITGTTTVAGGATLALNVSQSTFGIGGLVVNGTANLLNTNANASRTVTINSLSGAGLIQGNLGGTGTSSLTLALASATTGTFSGVIQNGNNSTVSFTKSGTGTQTLSGNNTYTGATTVSAGTLLINGSNASAVAVGSSAVLGGSGTISGAVTINAGGTLSPGNSPGILSTGNLSLAGTLYEQLGKAASGSQPVAGADYDQANVAGSVTLTGGDLTLSLQTGIETGDLYFIVNNDGADAVTGVFATLNGVSTTLNQGSGFTLGSYSFQISYTANSLGGTFTGGNDVALLVTAVPEPASWALVALGVSMVLGRSRRRATF